MSFKRKYYDEIFLTGLNNSFKQHLISRQDEFLQYVANKEDIENFYVMLLSVHSTWLEDVYTQMQEYYNSDFINLATGEDLDKIGELCGIKRSPATRAYTDLVFTTNKTLDNDYTIPAGVLVTNKNGVTYRTEKTGVILKENSSVSIPAYSTVTGVKGKVSENTLTSIETGNNNITLSGVTVTNPSSSSGGFEAQTDEEYREYLQNWTLIQQKGNEWSYKYHLNSYTGLDGYGLMPLWDGGGTVKVIVDRSDNTNADYLNELYKKLQADVCLFDDDVIVVDATKKDIDISIQVDVDIDQINPFSRTEKDSISLRTKSAVKLFINGGFRSDGSYYHGLNIGEDFIPHKLAVFLDNEIKELKDIKFNYPRDYISVSDEEIANSGNISVEVL